MPKTNLFIPGFFVQRRPRAVTFRGNDLLLGPLPVTDTFSTLWSDSSLVVILSGTGFVSVAGTTASLSVTLDGTQWGGSWKMFFNTANEHLAWPGWVFVTAPGFYPAGSRTLQIANGGNVSSDANDKYQWTAFELPP